MISGVYYTYVNDGVLKGAPCFEVNMTDGVGGEKDEAIDTILKIRNFKAPGCKLVMLEGKFVVESQDVLFGMVKSLSDVGYSVGARSNGKLFFPWMTLLKFNAVSPTGKWLGYKVQEFVHDLHFGVPQLPPEGASLFVTGPDDEVETFIKSSILLWRAWGSPVLYEPVAEED